ncbi:hypothetical protein PTTG_03222 [Puccinia triticina 1-1 BBBD Race 1]|uniref:Retrotransposon gag domain-containing protein n=1 Tax=Puccinia triticina (isolate 1-1 / race 1 (BBBD)) TaxID=630390 RepID=A0A180GUC4_PUCT1|nr:hypothetical protein PTTG_03222 [Puccinia triticina 1-1 BBBD Race 1]
MNFPSGSANPPPQDDPATMSTTEMMKAIMVIQQNTAKQLLATQTQVYKAQQVAQEAITQARADLSAVQKQARADVKANQEASAARFHTLKSQGTPGFVKDDTPRLALGRIDLQKICVSDRPASKGPFQEVKPFLQWIQGVQTFYIMKDTNLLSFYANKSPKYSGKTWNEFRARLFKFALPTKWHTELKQSVNQLKMVVTETFLEFSTRARTIQSLLNFDKHTLDDFNLAKAPLACLTSFSIGKCHFCKKHCGSPVGACPGPIDQTRVELPSSFVTPPKPANYIGPNAWKRGQAANRGGAGKPTGRPAGVAALSEEAPDLDELSASCVAQIDGQAEVFLLGYDKPLDQIGTKHELAALAGNCNTVTTTEGFSPLSDNKLVPEDQITFRCGSLLEGPLI